MSENETVSAFDFCYLIKEFVEMRNKSATFCNAQIVLHLRMFIIHNVGKYGHLQTRS